MNKRDIVIAFLLGIICTQSSKAEIYNSTVNDLGKSVVEAAKIIGMGQVLSGDSDWGYLRYCEYYGFRKI